MCFGTRLYDGNPCPYERIGGINWGECNKPDGAVCPDTEEEEEECEQE